MTRTVHTKIGRRSIVMPGARSLKIVTSMLMAPRIELMPFSRRARIHRSCPMPEYLASASGA